MGILIIALYSLYVFMCSSLIMARWGGGAGGVAMRTVILQKYF